MMGTILFWLGLWVVALTLFLFVSSVLVYWGTHYFRQQIATRFELAAYIVQEKQAPPIWTQSFQAKLSALKQAQATEARIERIGKRSQKYCLRQLDDLIRFFQQSPPSQGRDQSADGHQLADDQPVNMVDDLRKERERWAMLGWRAFIEIDD